MSWLEALRETAPAFDEEFGTLARFVPMMARPNRRSDPDPRRQPFEVIGVFHETYKIQGPGRSLKDGMSEVDASSQMCSFSVERLAMPEKITQGDVLELVELCREFRVLDIQFESPYRTRLILEDIKAPSR